MIPSYHHKYGTQIRYLLWPYQVHSKVWTVTQWLGRETVSSGKGCSRPTPTPKRFTWDALEKDWGPLWHWFDDFWREVRRSWARQNRGTCAATALFESRVHWRTGLRTQEWSPQRRVELIAATNPSNILLIIGSDHSRRLKRHEFLERGATVAAFQSSQGSLRFGHACQCSFDAKQWLSKFLEAPQKK